MEPITSKRAAPAKAYAEPSNPTTHAKFRLRGVDYVDHNHEDITFGMPVKEINVNYGIIEAALLDAGVPKEHAFVYVEAFAEKIRVGELSRAIAEMLERIG